MRQHRPAPNLALALLCATASTLAPAPAQSFGPGVHSREAQEVLRRLSETHPEYNLLAQSPAATSWLSLGAISPDLDFVSDTLSFGHEPGLSHHLIEAASDLPPEYRLFALGHLCHIASDGSSEAFVVPTLFASAAIGPTDLFADQPAYKEAEGLVESLGDLVTGDWHAIVDLLYDLWMPPANRAAFDAVFAWYCETSSAFLGRAVDCAAARHEVGATIGQLEGLVSGFDRAGAHDFVQMLVTLPIEDLIGLAVYALQGEAFGGLLGEDLDTTTSPWLADEVTHLTSTAFVERSFWATYDTLAALGPSFALDRLADRSSGWPSYDIPGIESGLVASALRFLPDDFDVRAGLLLDALDFRDPDGLLIESVTAAHAGQTLTATLRFYSALPLSGRLTARVRKDTPGLASHLDPVVGEASLDLDIDPTHYARAPRGLLTVPFLADLSDAQSFAVELSLDGDLPTLTTSRDRLWSIAELDLHGASFTELLQLFPRSLPVANPPAPSGLAVVRVIVAPSGPGLPNARVTSSDDARALTGARGFAVFPDLAPGLHPVAVEAPGYAPTAGTLELHPVTSATDLDAITRATFALHAIPPLTLPASPWSPSPTSVLVHIDPGPFAGEAQGFEVTVSTLDGPLGEANLDASGRSELTWSVPVADGTELVIRARARYRDPHGLGPAAERSLRVDASPPVLLAAPTLSPLPSCLDGGSASLRPPMTLAITVDEPHARPVALHWRLVTDTSSWGHVEFPPSPPGVSSTTATLSVDAPDVAVEALELRAINASGLETLVTIALAPPTLLPACPASPDPDPESPDPAPDTSSTPDIGLRSSGGGCGSSHGAAALALLALASILVGSAIRNRART